jgi:hypothetical protein
LVIFPVTVRSFCSVARRTGWTRRLAVSAWISLCLLALLPAPAQAAQGVEVRARLESGVVRQGDRTGLVLTAVGTLSGQVEELPQVEGLRFGAPQSPSTRSFTTISGGRRVNESSITWLIPVEGLAEGNFEIPPIGVRVGGEVYRSEPQLLTVQRDLVGADLGFIELRGGTERVIEGLPLELELRFGWDRALADETNYANLALPWWGNLDGALIRALPVRGALREVDVYLNRSSTMTVAQLPDSELRGRKFATYSLRFELVPLRSGELELPLSFVQFGTTRSDFLGQQTLLRSYFAQSPALRLSAEPLPSAGQPFDFGGAIGSIEARASADTRDVIAGDSIKFVVEWTGSGNFDYFEAPDPSRQAAFAGFRYFGMTEEKLPGRRRVTYDLAPLRPEVTELPPLELPYFDVVEWAYRRLATQPIPILVRPLEGAEELDDRERYAEDLADIRTTALRAGGLEASAPGLGTLGGGLVGLVLAWLALRSAVRQGGRDPGSTLERRRARALRHLERELRTSLDPETDLRAFAAFLAARTGEETEAWVGRDALREFGPGGRRPLPPDSLANLQRLGRALEAAVFGGGERVPHGAIVEGARELLEDGL